MSSLRSRRRRAVVLFLATYVLFWTAVGILMTAIVRDAELLPGVDSTTVLVVSLTLAACWELTSAKRRALRACQLELPLPPCGREADLGCVRAGALYAQRCATACWALMLPMAAASGLPLLAMLLATIIAAQKLLVRGATLAAPAVGAILGTAFIIGVT
jgi:predicted metal-binding membrane protein